MPLLLNLAHPLTPGQLASLHELLGEFELLQPGARQWDVDQPFAPQIHTALEELGISPERWQAGGIVVCLPTLHAAAAVMLAALHGRMGHFPAVVRLRPVQTELGTGFELAEIVNLDAVRRDARGTR